MGSRSDVRTLLIGIDAACDRVLEPLFEAGELPTLSSIYEEGASGSLESQIPPWTASAWPSLYTGMNPGKHGVYSFLSFDGYDWDVVNATDVRERTLWELLDRNGLDSVVVNAPVTHPPRSFDGALVPGYTAPEDPDCHPSGLLSEVRDAIGDYRVYPAAGTDADIAEKYRSLVTMRGEAFRYLAERFDPAFGFVQFQATDSIFHRRPEDEDAIRTIYREVDRQIGETIDACDPDDVIVASDHGMGPYDGHEFRANSFLRDEGYVETESGGGGMPTWATVRERTLKQGVANTTRDRGLVERVMAAGATLGLTSQRLGGALQRVGLAEFVADRVPLELVTAGATQVDFPDSAAYMRSRIELGVRINLRGREPDGVVPASEYESVRSDLVERLRAATTPDGEPVFEAVGPREEYFHGPESDGAVDVVAVPAAFDHFLSATLRRDQFGEPSEPWNHKREGTFAAVGENVAPARVDGAHLFDVAPTVLATLDVPVDERMDGEAVACVDSPATREYPRFDSDESVETADEAVEKRLAELGYLE